KTGNFETLPAEPAHTRIIEKSYNALLLETAQAIDESNGGEIEPHLVNGERVSPLAALSQIEGVEFVLALKAGPNNLHESRGLENPDRIASWTRSSLDSFRALGEQLQAGNIEEVEGLGPQRNVALARQGQMEFCLGWQVSLSPQQIRDQTK